MVHTFFSQTLGRQKQEDLCECKASLVYRGSSSQGYYTEKPSLQKEKKKKKVDLPTSNGLIKEKKIPDRYTQPLEFIPDTVKLQPKIAIMVVK